MVKIGDYLREQRINIQLNAGTKEEAIKALMSSLKNDPDISNIDLFLSDLMEREELGTTGIGLGLALPHARTDGVNSLILLIGRLTAPVDFNSLDGHPVNLIFLMGTPKNDVQNYLKILAHLTRLLKKEVFRSALLNAQSPAEIIECFNKEEA